MNSMSFHATRKPGGGRVRPTALVGALVAALGLGFVAPSVVPAATTVPFKLSANTSAVQVAPGAQAIVTVIATRNRGFASPIYLGVSGVPRGVGVKLARNPLKTGSASSTVITISPSSSAVRQTFTLSVSGSSKGKTARVSFRVAILTSGPTLPPTSAPAATVPTTTLASTTTLPGATSLVTTTTVAPTTTKSATTTSIAASDYTLAVEPTALSMAAGGTATATLRITRFGGFNQPLDATIDGLPTGMTGSVDAIDGAATASTVRLASSSTVAAGTYDLIVRARGRGATLRVTVGTSVVSASPSALTVNAGSSVTATVALARAVSASAVGWSVDVLPAGITTSFTPNGTTAVTSTLTINASSSVAAGTYIVTLRASSDGGSVTTPITISVTASVATATISPATLTIVPGGSGAVTITPTALPTGTPVLNVTGFPAGTAAATSVNGTTFTYNFTIPTNTALGAYPVTLQVTQGGGSSSGTFSLIVAATAPSNTPPASTTAAFVISATPATLNIARGATGVVTIPVGWTAGVVQQAITFSVFGVPAGTVVGYTLNPNVQGTTVNLSIPTTATPGTYTLTVSGNVASLGTNNTIVTLTVT